ncbi:MAG: phytanoyl-CoA dioxygenase family protein [Planctomycetes bacterium]|nr:phytanoyl-CoA dioxygenase family protein [Planctomycetota bacterium]
MLMDQALVEQYQRDGFVILENVFSAEEVAAMLDAVVHGDRVATTTVEAKDAKGMPSRLAIWFDLGEDIWSAVSTCPRLVNPVRILLGEEAAFFHGKVILKEAKKGGAWEWHQDYGYWYDQGFAFPRLASASIALDPATRENGCLQVLRGSHMLGRVTHGRFGTQTGIDPERMKLIEPLFERVYCEMKPGSVLFFHCNLLHASGQNTSDHHRRSVIMCYNALSNPQLAVGYRDNLGLNICAEKRPVPVGADDAILKAAARVTK